ncbi:MAG: hypothetical protein ACOCWM_05205, partial [Cyclobacteriaceae bacterium]
MKNSILKSASRIYLILFLFVPFVVIRFELIPMSDDQIFSIAFGWSVYLLLFSVTIITGRVYFVIY